MSEMSYLEKLLDGVEVEWLPLGELGELVRGNGLPKSDFTESGVPAIHYGGNDSNLLIVFYVQIMPDDFVMQLHRF